MKLIFTPAEDSGEQEFILETLETEGSEEENGNNS